MRAVWIDKKYGTSHATLAAGLEISVAYETIQTPAGRQGRWSARVFGRDVPGLSVSSDEAKRRAEILAWTELKVALKQLEGVEA